METHNCCALWARRAQVPVPGPAPAYLDSTSRMVTERNRVDTVLSGRLWKCELSARCGQMRAEAAAGAACGPSLIRAGNGTVVGDV